ncbi:MAG: hypothetical protein QW273_00310 [Candidatus Pacearchaeota archaeon]
MDKGKNIKKGETLLDPFCGIGIILQEALLKNINCIGVDKDKKAIISCEKNLSWLKKNYSISANYSLLNKDSLKIQNILFDAIVSEPSFGPILKRKLSKNEKKNFINSFEEKIIPLLLHFRKIKKEDSRIVLTFPSFEEVKVDLNKIKKLTKLEIFSYKDLIFPINERRDKQYVSRDIVVLV